MNADLRRRILLDEKLTRAAALQLVERIENVEKRLRIEEIAFQKHTEEYDRLKALHRNLLMAIQRDCPHPEFHRGTAECERQCVICGYSHNAYFERTDADA